MMEYDNEGKWKWKMNTHNNIVGYIVSADFTRHAPCRQTGVKIAPFLVVNAFQ